MIDISKNNIISMTRGDSWKAPLFLNKGTALKPLRYILENEDRVYLAIMEPNQPFEQAIVKKTFTNQDVNQNDDILIEITPDDTACLIPGQYYYQIKSRLINKFKPIYKDLTITNETLLVKGTLLMKGSIINGTDVSVISKGLNVYELPSDIRLSNTDIIKGGSKIKVGSILNGITIEPKYDVNTVVPKTEFYITE